jgi:hypothetical protein
MRITIVATILAVATTADASRAKPKPAVMVANGGTVTYHKLSPVDDDHAKLRLVLATTSKDAREVSVPITLPDRFVVTGLSLSMPGEDSVVARVRVTMAARATYDRVVEDIKDPALVEWTDDRHVMLRVFPVARGASATVTLELAAIRTTTSYVNEQRSLLAVPSWAHDSAPADDDYEAYWPPHNDDPATPVVATVAY